MNRKFLKIYMFLILTGSSLFLQSQIPSIPTDSTMYVYRVSVPSGIGQFHIRDLVVKIKGDTVLNNKTYSKIYYSWALYDTNYNSPNNLLHCFMRSDTNKKVYARYPITYNGDTSDILLYDFGLNVGDTFDIRVFGSLSFDTNYCHKSFKHIVTIKSTYWDEFWNSNSTTLEMESIGTETTYPYFQFSEFYGYSHMLLYNELHFYNLCYWGVADSIFGANRNCVWHKGKWEFPCDLYGIGINETETSFNVMLNPNPFSNQAELSFEQGVFNEFQLIDILGNIVYQCPIEYSSSSITIHRNGMARGFYLGRLLGNTNKQAIIKIVIN